MHVRLRAAKSVLDKLRRLQGKRIHNVSRFLLEVGPLQSFQDAQMCAFGIVVKEKVSIGHRVIIARKNYKTRSDGVSTICVSRCVSSNASSDGRQVQDPSSLSL